MVPYIEVVLYGMGGIGIVVAGVALLVTFQEKQVYVPILPGLSKSYLITPARLPTKPSGSLLQTGIKLHSWLIKLRPDFPCPTIIFFEENAGNIAHRLEMVKIMLQQL